MILEFMGCTGAGKTTFAAGVVDRLRAGGLAVRDHCHFHSSSLVSVGNAMRVPFHLLQILSGWPRYDRYLRVMWRAVRDGAPDPLRIAARAGAVIRILGEHVERVRSGARRICVVDQGVLGTVHLAFAGLRPPLASEIEPFVATVPLADVVVWVDAPLDALVDRALARAHPPRELRRRAPDDLRARLASLRATFRTLAHAPRAGGRVLRAWNPPSSLAQRETLIDDVARALRTRLDAWRG